MVYEATGPVKHVAINLSASGQLLALVANRKIRVISYLLVCASAVTVQFKSGGTGGTALTGAMPFAANGGTAAPECISGHFETAEGENLYVTLGSSVQVSGHMTYQEIK